MGKEVYSKSSILGIAVILVAVISLLRKYASSAHNLVVDDAYMYLTNQILRRIQ